MGYYLPMLMRQVPLGDSAMMAERLLKLADHLEHGKLGHRDFDFGVINVGQLHTDECGTAGCAMGELPVAFPDDFVFAHDQEDGCSVPQLKDVTNRVEWTVDIKAFFDIDQVEMNHLFYAYFQQPAKFGGITLHRSATKNQVAGNIREFVARKIEDSLAK